MILYNIDSTGNLREWEIHAERNTIIISYGLHDGKKQVMAEEITEGKGGRNIHDQLHSRMNSRINKQLAKGYFHTIEEARAKKGHNEINTYKPMLAQVFEKQKSVNTDGAVLQRKLDGNRLLVTRNKGKLITYSRGGKIIETLDHIKEQLDWIEEGMTVDGEIYNHGVPLRTINSWVRRKQKDTLKLNYHVYDVIEDLPFKERFARANNKSSDNIIIEPYWDFKSNTDMKLLFANVRNEGYEGLMLRTDGVGYQPGKRSKSLLKIKMRLDAEAKVIDIERAKDDTGILVLQMSNGNIFKCVAPGGKEAKLHAGMMPELYVGKTINYSYAYLTDDGIPFHAVAERWV